MLKALKWIGIVIGVMLVLVVVAGGVLYASGSKKLARTYNIQPPVIAIPEDEQTIARGAYLFSVSCAGCHGDDLGGKAILDDPTIGYLAAPNLTDGQGGIGSTYSDTDFVRAIRHGIAADGRGLLIMPSKAYWYFGEEDLAAVIAYINSATPVDHDAGSRTVTVPGTIMLAVGAFGDAISAEVIDHDAPLSSAPERGMTAAYGEYLINTGDCANCHGSDLAGAQSPEPGSPFSSNLTPGGVAATWANEDFIQTMRTGMTPDGRQLDSSFMPYESYGRLNDADLTAMFLYLQSLPAQETAAK